MSQLHAKTKDLQNFKTLKLIAGLSGLDFLNTVKYRGQLEPGDSFQSMSDIIEWAQIANIINKDEYNILMVDCNCSESAVVFDEICEFREYVRVFLENSSKDSDDVEVAIRYIESTISKLAPTVKINRKTAVLEKTYPIKGVKDLKDRIFSCVDSVLQKRGQLTIKTCSGIDCDWLFADTSKARRRKWCDLRTCGNLARVRKYREN